MEEKPMQSMYEFLGRKAGGMEVGKKLYEFAKSKNSKVKTRDVKTPSYEGKVMLYESDILKEFFKIKTNDL